MHTVLQYTYIHILHNVMYFYLISVCPLAAHPDPNRFIQYKPNGEPVEKKCDEGLIFSVGQCSCAWSNNLGTSITFLFSVYILIHMHL